MISNFALFQVRSFVEMADPLSMLTDDIEDEEIEIDTSSSTNDKSQNSSVSQKKTDDIDHDASHSSAEHEPGSKEFDVCIFINAQLAVY